MAAKVNDLDKKLDPESAAYIKLVRSHPPLHLLSIDELRAHLDDIRNHYPPEDVHKIEDMDIPGPAGRIPVRVYTPEGKGPFPIIVFYHGGGWCIGSLYGYEGMCAAVANRMAAIVFSVGYRLAPEHPFPAAVDDCYAGLEYAAKNAGKFNADPARLAVMGDSAGGNLAAAITLKSKKENGPKIASQVLVYPATDLSNLDIESCRLYGEGYDLDKEMIEIFRAHYLPRKEDFPDRYASPALAESLKGLPRALVITAECDPLRDDGKKYADKLKKAGVPVKYSMYKGVTHGFLSFTTFHAAQKALDEIAAFIR